MIALALVIFITFDSLPTILSVEEVNGVLLSLFPLFGVLIVEVVGLLLVWQLWFWRNRLKAKYGSVAYQRVFLFGFGGIVWILTVALSEYIPFYSFALSFWKSEFQRFLWRKRELNRE